jgi:hypothetical protein
LEIKVIEEFNLNFWEDFDALSANSFMHNIQYQSKWLKPYIKYLLEGQVVMICAYEGKELVGCLPLQKTLVRATRFYSYRQFQLLGAGPTDFCNILANDKNSQNIIKGLLTFFTTNFKWDELKLDYLPQSTLAIKVIESKFRNTNYNIRKSLKSGFNYENTVGDWEEYVKSIFKRKNKDLAKAERRLENDNLEWSKKVFTSNVYSHFISCIDLYASRRETLGQYNYYKDENYRKFLETVCSNFEKSGAVELNVLRAKNEEVLAIQLDFIGKNTRYHWNHAFNEDYKRYSPGKVLLKEILKDSFSDDQISTCNHMRGLSSYKKKFTSYEDKLASFTIINKKSLRVISGKIINKIVNKIK